MLLKPTLQVRQNVINNIALIEISFLPLRTITYCRQLNYLNDQDRRTIAFDKYAEDGTAYMKHYMDLDAKYQTVKDIKTEFTKKLRGVVIGKVQNDSNYKQYIYLKVNLTFSLP